METQRFENSPTGHLVPISGHSRSGPFEHVAFVPNPLPPRTPPLSTETFTAVAAARAALASLDATARRLPDPALLRRPTLRREAQSTSALEGTFAPLEDVLAADEDESPATGELREVLNYVRAAEHAFAWLADGRPLTAGLLTDLQGHLVAGTVADTDQAGRIRSVQVVIGASAGARVDDARFVPSPPGPELDAQVRGCVDWIVQEQVPLIDPVVAAGMAHYQFETLHPFNDGNGRIGRLLVVLHLLARGVLTEPSLTVSPWFEARRAEYFDRLTGVSAEGDWDPWLTFFAEGLRVSAEQTERLLLDVLEVQTTLERRARDAGRTSANVARLVGLAVEQPYLTVRQVERRLGLTYAGANKLVGQMVDARVLEEAGGGRRPRRFSAPDVLEVLLRVSG